MLLVFLFFFPLCIVSGDSSAFLKLYEKLSVFLVHKLEVVMVIQLQDSSIPKKLEGYSSFLCICSGACLSVIGLKSVIQK